MNIHTVDDFNAALERGPYAWPGGYPLFFITDDGGALSFDAAESEAEYIRDSIENQVSDGWRVVALAINYEDNVLFCDHTNALIECAYSEE